MLFLTFNSKIKIVICSFVCLVTNHQLNGIAHRVTTSACNYFHFHILLGWAILISFPNGKFQYFLFVHFVFPEMIVYFVLFYLRSLDFVFHVSDLAVRLTRDVRWVEISDRVIGRGPNSRINDRLSTLCL